MKTTFAVIAMLLACVGMVFAQSNTSTIDQYGSNIGKVVQTGSYNNADIDQGVAGTPVTNNHVQGYATDWIEGAFINQTGAHNDAWTSMMKAAASGTGSTNGAAIDQIGDYNKAYQDIQTAISRTNNWNRMGLDIDQTGDNNYANQKTVASFGTYGIQGMWIYQEGDYNIADQYMKGGAYMRDQVEIKQVGNNNNNTTMSGNTYDVSATGLGDPLGLPWAYKPAGSFTQYMYQNGGSAIMHVTGNDNNTYQYQEYTVWSLSGQDDAEMYITGNTNDAAQGQLGEYNYSNISVGGDRNIATTGQDGDSNIATISTTGDDNVAGIKQVDNLNNGAILQVGNNNTATILQQP
jgi:hypothetical protein